MGLAVIVVSYNAGPTLRKCLESLTCQPEAAEIIVSDCSTVDPAISLGPLFPQARFLHFAEKRTVPQLRWAGLAVSRGDLIASTEARCVPASDWCARLVQGHREWPESPAVGGQVCVAQPATALSFGLFLCEYGAFAAPAVTGPVKGLTGANISFKRAECESLQPLLDAGHWETVLQERWVAEGKTLALTGALVTFWNSMSVASILRQRFAYGRGYAAVRAQNGGPVRRMLFALFCPLLPILLCTRLAGIAAQRHLMRKFLSAFFWILLFQTAWSAGECVGYLLGASNRNEIY